MYVSMRMCCDTQKDTIQCEHFFADVSTKHQLFVDLLYYVGLYPASAISRRRIFLFLGSSALMPSLILIHRRKAPGRIILRYLASGKRSRSPLQERRIYLHTHRWQSSPSIFPPMKHRPRSLILSSGLVKITSK